MVEEKQGQVKKTEEVEEEKTANLVDNEDKDSKKESHDNKESEQLSSNENSEPQGEANKKKEVKEDILGWEPKTKLGREVKDGKIKNIDEILDNKRKILESEIVDFLIDVKSDLVNIGQSKGKFGGGKRRIWRQTQRKTKAKNIPTFSTLAVIGDENGHVGIGSGKSMETLPAREKSIRKAKLNIFKVKRACSGFDCACSELHTVPFKVTGKTGSVRVTLIPASQGTGLVVANELKKGLRLAGVNDIYSKTFGRKRTTFNIIKAGIDALEKTNIK